MGRPYVAVVGDVGIDVVARLTGEVVFGQETRARIVLAPGGAGGNTAAWLARHDLDVSLIARIGRDQAGRTAMAELTAAGVECRFAVDERLPTCCVVVLGAPDGERTMLSDRGANAALEEADIALPDLPAGRPAHLHLSGYVLLDRGSRPAGRAALRLAREAGWTTSVDPQSATHIAAVGARSFRDWITGVNLLLPNDSELEALGGASAVGRLVDSIAVTHGRAGASWISDSAQVTVPVPAAYRTDSTGAGDAFNAGLIAAWLTGAGPESALREGVRAGSAAASAVGARPPR